MSDRQALVDGIVTEWATARGVDSGVVLAALEEFQDATGYKVDVFGRSSSMTGAPRQLLDLHDIEIRNFKNTKKRKIEIQPGVGMIKGPNGSGKSSWLQALRYNLRGMRAIGDVSSDRLIRLGEKSMLTTANFTGMRVTRGVSLRKIARGARAGEVEVDNELDVEVEGSKDSTPKKAQALLESALGADIEFILDTCLITQGDLTAMMDASPAPRRELIYRLMALDPCEDAAKRMRKWVDDLQRTNFEINGRATNAQRERDAVLAKRNEIPLSLLKDKLAKLESSADPAAARVAQLADLRTEIRGLEKLMDEYGRTMRQRAEFTEKLNELRKAPELALAHDDLSHKIAHAERAYRLAAEARAGKQALVDAIVTRGKSVADLPSVCPTCELIGKQCELTPELKAARKADLLADWKANALQLKALQAEESDTLREYERLDAAREQQDKDKATRAAVEQQIGMLEKWLATTPDDAILKHKECEHKIGEAKRKLAALKADEDAPDERAELRKKIAQGDALDAQIAELDKKREAAKEKPIETDGAHLLVKAFAKDGIPLMLAGRHAARINEIASEITADSGEPLTYRFNVDLEIEVVSAAGAIHPLLAAGSERQRGALVLVAALGRYMQELLNVQVPLLWIDELPFQDDENVETIIAIIKRLTRWYPKVVFAASQWDRFEGVFDYEIALDLDGRVSAFREFREAPPKAAPATGFTEDAESMKAHGRTEPLTFELAVEDLKRSPAPAVELDPMEQRAAILEPLAEMIREEQAKAEPKSPDDMLAELGDLPF